MICSLPLLATSPLWSPEPCAELGVSILSLILSTLHLTLFSCLTVIFLLPLRILVQTSVALKAPIPQPIVMAVRDGVRRLMGSSAHIQ